MTNAATSEQRLLLLSSGVTLTLAGAGIGIGLWIGARTIVFDGMFDLVDAAMTGAAWFVARLIARGDDRRFQFGYWHIEPMLAFLNGSLLLLACAYGFTDAIGALLRGGRIIRVDIGAGYAVVTALVSGGVYLFIRSKGQELGSLLLDLDARSWLMDTLLSVGLALSFGAVALAPRLGLAWLAPYADPVILLGISAAMAPLPISTLLKAGRELLQIAPPELDARVSKIAADVARRHGFVEARSYVAQSGRAQFVEIGFVGLSSDAVFSLRQLDAIREEVATAMGGLRPGYWLTIDVTADPRWI